MSPGQELWITTEFAETSGVGPAQTWFNGLRDLGVVGAGVPLHNLAQSGFNTNADAVIAKYRAANIKVYGYARPVESLITFYNQLNAASKAAIVMLQLDVEDVGHPFTRSMYTAALQVKPVITLYTNFGLFGDVMGYGLSGFADIPLHMRDLYTVPATLITQVPLDMYHAFTGKLFESWDNNPRLMPADWKTRIGVQWADPLTVTVSALSVICTINVFDTTFISGGGMPTPNLVFKPFTASAAATPVTAWTPPAGKRLRLLGLHIGVGTGCTVTITEGSGGTVRWSVFLTASNGGVFLFPGNGILFNAPDLAAILTRDTVAGVTGTLFGIEEQG